MPAVVLDHIILPAPDLELAAEPFLRLGLTLTPPASHLEGGTANRACFVSHAGAESYIELLTVHDRGAAAAAPANASLIRALDSAPALLRLMLRTEDPRPFDELFPGAVTSVRTVSRAGGAPIADVAEMADAGRAGCEFRVIRYAETPSARYARHAAAGLFEHRFPLKRLDHLALIPADLEATTHYWTGTLGVAVRGEIEAPGMLIRQLAVGDTTLELLAPLGADSRLAARPRGLISVAAFEVADLASAVALARERGFTPSDPGPGPLPGTRTATIPPAECSGLALQLLQHV
ncbi:MAG: VOC family protein [Chloroflexi bacterium]|nr:VOC family protein [Chloroflexota bacterium]